MAGRNENISTLAFKKDSRMGRLSIFEKELTPETYLEGTTRFINVIGESDLLKLACLTPYMTIRR